MESSETVVFCYIRDDLETAKSQRDLENGQSRYTADMLAQALQIAGCKPRHAVKTATKVFYVLTQRALLAPSEAYSLANTLQQLGPGIASVTLSRNDFESLVFSSVPTRGHDNQPHLTLADFRLAASVKEAKRPIIILLCGTSGTGKSTLASILAARLGITNIISTDTIRGMMRSCASDEERKALPSLWCSTYTAGTTLGPASWSSINNLNESVINSSSLGRW